jgi:hypothetical protein
MTPTGSCITAARITATRRISERGPQPLPGGGLQRGCTSISTSRRKPKPRMPLYHLVGAVDPITALRHRKKLNDGLPQDPARVDRIQRPDAHQDQAQRRRPELGPRPRAGVERAAAEAMKKRGTAEWHYSLDFNEKCPNVDYLLDMLRQVSRSARRRLRADPVHRTADQARPEGRPRT